MWSAGEGDDRERFLADLRALRDRAALELDEVAARAHYPSNVLKEAENGPSLPGLPILAAFVRACDGDVLEWEERWRRLGFESRADPSLPVRPAGASPAAVAGARAAVSVAPPDAYDPDRIRAALRGSHARSDRGDGAGSRAAPGRDMPGPDIMEPRTPESPAAWNARTSWEGVERDGRARWDGAAADLSGAKPNGNHHVSQPGDGSSGLPDNETPDVTRADAIRRDPFSGPWPRDGDRTPAAESESRWPDQAEAGPQVADADSWFTPREKADGERTEPATAAQPSPAAADNWFSPRQLADSTVAPRRPAEPDVAPPQEHAGSAAAGTVGSWTPSADVSRASDPPGAPGAADRTTPLRTPAAAVAPSRTAAGPAVPPGPVVPQRKSRSERLYPMRVLVIIVVAALIGSILVLLLR
jgi:hypothetical protein